MNHVMRSDVRHAEGETERREAELALGSLHVESGGHQLQQLKPVLIAAAAVAALALGVAVFSSRRRREARWQLPASEPSALRTAARAAGLGLVRLVAQRVAGELAARVSGAVLEPRPQPHVQ